MCIILGIGGLTGSLCVLAPGFSPSLYPMPVISVRNKLKKTTTYNLEKIKTLIIDVKPTHVLLEYAQSMPLQGVASSECYGLMKGLLFGLGVRTNIVKARTWQKVMLPLNYKEKYKSTKEASIASAKELYPNTSLKRTTRSNKDCHGMSDALLIAEYGRLLLEVKK